MGYIFSRDAEPRSIKKALKLVEEAEAMIIANELDRARANIRKAAEVIAATIITPANSTEVSDTLVRMADDMQHCAQAEEALKLAERAVKISPDNINAEAVQARLLAMAGRSDEAMSLIDDLLVRTPDRKQLWLLKGIINDKDGHAKEALDSYKKALAIDPLDLKLYDSIIALEEDKLPWMRKKAELLLRLAKNTEASRELDRIIAIDPRAIEALMLKADLFMRTNDVVKAQQTYEIILSRDPLNKTALIGKARQNGREGNVPEALRFYKDALRVDPADIVTWNEVAALLLVANRYEESGMAYDRALAIDPGNSDALDGKAKVTQAMGKGTEVDSLHSRLTDIKQMATAAPLEHPKVEEHTLSAEIDAEDRLREAKSMMASARYHDALKLLDRALKFAPDRVDILSEVKECYKHMGKDRKVIELADQILQLQPNNDLALLDKGVAMDRIGKNSNSVEFYKRVLRIHPSDKVVLKDASTALFNLERYEEAYDMALLGSKTYPDEVIFWRVQGDSLFAIRRYHEAVESFSKASQLSQRDKSLVYSRGLALEAAKRYEEAAAAYDRVIDMDPKDKNAWISKGITLEWLDRYGESLTCYDKALGIDRKYRFAQVRRGYALAKMERHEDAVLAFDKALEMGHKDIDVLEAKKRSLMALARLDEVIKVCERITRLDPKNAEAYVDLGLAYFRLEDYKKAVTAYDQGLLASPDDTRVLDLKKVALIASKDWEKVVRVCEEIISIDPTNKASLVDMAGALEALGRAEQAVDLLQRAVAMDPDDKNLLLRLGLILTAAGKYQEAVQTFDTAWRLDCTDHAILDNKGRALLFLGKYQEALHDFDVCIEANPANPRFFADRGRALASLERFQEAIAAFDQATSLDQSYAEAWKFKGNAYYKLGDFNRAVISFSRAIDLGMEDGQTLRMKGRALENMGRKEEARQIYTRASLVNPNDALVWERLALIEEQDDYIDNAFSAIDKASTLDPGNARLWMERAAISEKLGKDEDTLKSYDCVLGININDAIAWNGKGMVLLRMHNYDAAVRAFDKALELDPAMGSAREGMVEAHKHLHESEVKEYAIRLMEIEARQGRRIGKEEAFRQANVPYEYLDEVMAYLDKKEPVDVDSLTADQLEEYESSSRAVLLLASRNPNVTSGGLKLSDVMAAMPRTDIITAKRMLSYIETVNALDLSQSMPDSEVQDLMRTAMNMPEERRNILSLMETFGIGLYKARKLKVAMNAFRAMHPTPEPVIVRERKRPVPTKAFASTKPAVKSAPMAKPRVRKAPAPPPLTEVPIPPPLDEPEEMAHNGPDAVFLPPAEEDIRPARFGRAQPLLFDNTERELYATFYGQEKKQVDTTSRGNIKARKCLFHGDTAMSSCPECGSLLCQQCVASGLCPRCQTPIRVKNTSSVVRKAKASLPHPEEEEVELEKIDVSERKPVHAAEAEEAPEAASPEEDKERDWTRL